MKTAFSGDDTMCAEHIFEFNGLSGIEKEAIAPAIEAAVEGRREQISRILSSTTGGPRTRQVNPLFYRLLCYVTGRYVYRGTSSIITPEPQSQALGQAAQVARLRQYAPLFSQLYQKPLDANMLLWHPAGSPSCFTADAAAAIISTLPVGPQ
jgi:hypothetical protein